MSHNKQVVTATVTRDGGALNYASTELRNNEQVVAATVVVT